MVSMQLELDLCQRWSLTGEQRWQHPRYSVFTPGRYGVKVIDVKVARPFVVACHYSHAWLAPKLCYGMFDLAEGAERLVGAAVLSIPVKAVAEKSFPGLVPFYESVELGRFVLLDAVPANGESWFLAEVLRLAGQTGIRGITSFADPVPRTTLATEGNPAEIIFGGHIGKVYGQCMNLPYTGTSGKSIKILMPDGRIFNEQARSKLLGRRQGWQYAAAFLQSYGARELTPDEDTRAYLDEALVKTQARRLKHSGCHRFHAITGPTKRIRAAVKIGLPLLPAPRRLITA